MTISLFSFDAPESVAGWRAIDDAVMGGVSSSAISYVPECRAVFSGTVSLAKNGGFASVRSPSFAVLGGGGVFLLTVRGDGKRYKFSVRTDAAFDGVSYQAAFQPPPGEWVVVRLAAADFLPKWRGRIVNNAPQLDPARAQQLGLMIADLQAGGFRLEVAAIELAD
jgi:NADH dehydrogenase [ubiquinone] 1 alpha subcomplex assembly factor 1